MDTFLEMGKKIRAFFLWVKHDRNLAKKNLFMVEWIKLPLKNMEQSILHRQKQLWRDLKSFEDLRNKIIHHKEIEDINIDLKKAKECRDLVKEVISYLNKLLFK